MEIHRRQLYTWGKRKNLISLGCQGKPQHSQETMGDFAALGQRGPFFEVPSGFCRAWRGRTRIRDEFCYWYDGTGPTWAWPGPKPPRPNFTYARQCVGQVQPSDFAGGERWENRHAENTESRFRPTAGDISFWLLNGRCFEGALTATTRSAAKRDNWAWTLSKLTPGLSGST